jgi:uncharacterized protein
VRVCLDTNVLVAAFATRGLCADILRVCLTEHELVLGEVHLKELSRALKRKLRMDDAGVAAVIDVFNEIEIVPKPKTPAAFPVRDSDDRWIVATALDAHADVLVTGDNDLLTAAKKSPLPIVSPRDFWQLLH